MSNKWYDTVEHIFSRTSYFRAFRGKSYKRENNMCVKYQIVAKQQMCGAGSAKILYGGKLAFIIVQKCHAREKKCVLQYSKVKICGTGVPKNIIIVSIFHTDILNLVTLCLKKQHNTCKIYNQKNYPFKGVLQIPRLDKQKRCLQHVVFPSGHPSKY